MGPPEPPRNTWTPLRERGCGLTWSPHLFQALLAPREMPGPALNYTVELPWGPVPPVAPPDSILSVLSDGSRQAGTPVCPPSATILGDTVWAASPV